MIHNGLTVYQKIRNDIILGELKQNEKLTEAKLAKKYNVSRTPIREAIKQLEIEYFIKDGYIFVPTSEEYRDIFEMRILLETHALSKACVVFTQEDLTELKGYTDIDIDQENEETIIETNDLFHQKIMKATNNQFIIDTYQKLKSYIYLFSKTVIDKRRPGLIEEHKAIVEAMVNHNDKQAIQLLEEHLKKDLEFSLYYLINNTNK
ncbi:MULTISPECIES: GntR family transcriptional regulator [Staphylococcus]|uniref:GntR family transcriptional regulator n=1 Tax=Staphylococcus TaxID=1279 RepID=UPI00085BC72D|nr:MULTISPECIES: GntR family transcriptional regulator [Staphylococcus]OFQ93260.1 GntR family transcriptional regulator [Staphylococcus sp. HMSC065A08]PTG48058.1 GntR family transcriptional regulator [Staphylococcus cohnii]SCS92520.1 gluconate operon transcriptional repressor [Staphylococcus cohnii subsp. cohnii]MDK7753924.1 GntR family transcriptional regulator [Staphylococcus sp. UMB10092B]MDU9350294.1 GntR family transcriptional regulator [Staphylococcus ureilyticus]